MIPIDATDKWLVEGNDGARTIADIGEAAPDGSRVLFAQLWWSDQVASDASRAAIGGPA